jgi:hypothetical protein
MYFIAPKILVDFIGRCIFRNSNFAWWFILCFAIAGVATGICFIFAPAGQDRLFLRISGPIVLVFYSGMLYLLWYANRNDLWESFCRKSYEQFDND